MADLWSWYLTGGEAALVVIELLLLNRQRRLLLLDTQHCRFFVAYVSGRCRPQHTASP